MHPLRAIAIVLYVVAAGLFFVACGLPALGELPGALLLAAGLFAFRCLDPGWLWIAWCANVLALASLKASLVGAAGARPAFALALGGQSAAAALSLLALAMPGRLAVVGEGGPQRFEALGPGAWCWIGSFFVLLAATATHAAHGHLSDRARERGEPDPGS